MKVISLFLVFIYGCQQLKAGEYTEYVNPQIDRNNSYSKIHSNQFLGSTLPFGRISVYLIPQNEKIGVSYIDSVNDSFFHGFGHVKAEHSELKNHLDVCLKPTLEENKERDLLYKTLDWKPGYCKVMLEDSIVAETTATLRTGLHNYTYPQGSNKMLWLSFFKNPYDSLYNKEIIKPQIKKKDTKSIEGFQIINNNHTINKIYFSIKFSDPIKSFSLVDDNGKIFDIKETNILKLINPKALLSFEGESSSLLIKIGLSDISIENAKENLEKESISQDFANYIAQADSIWDDILGRIEMKGNEKNKIQFYTALYKTFLQSKIVSDINGEWCNPEMSISKLPGKETQLSLSYLGESFRLINPLYTLISPDITKNYVNSMLRVFEFEECPYVWDRIDNDITNINEPPIVPIVVDATLKRIPGINFIKVWNMVKYYSLTCEPDTPAEIFQRYGYMPENYFPQSVTYTLEKSFDEWCAVRLARIYGDVGSKARLNNLANNYRNLYNVEIHSFLPKDMEGNWIIKKDINDENDNMDFLLNLETMSPYYWYVHYDIKDIIKLAGGKIAFEKQLDNLFNSFENNFNKISQNQIEYYKNFKKSLLHSPYFYNYVGKQRKTRETLTKLMMELPVLQNKIKDDSDEKLLAAWYIFNSLGFYPVNPCGGYFDLGNPFFDECILHLPNGKDFIISSNRKEEDYYKAVKITLNDKPVRTNYITYEEIMKGGKLVFGS